MLAWCRDRLDGWTDWLYPVWSPLSEGHHSLYAEQTHLKVGFSSGSSSGQGAIITTTSIAVFGCNIYSKYFVFYIKVQKV